jgi:hypothetical protein
MVNAIKELVEPIVKQKKVTIRNVVDYFQILEAIDKNPTMENALKHAERIGEIESQVHKNIDRIAYELERAANEIILEDPKRNENLLRSSLANINSALAREYPDYYVKEGGRGIDLPVTGNSTTVLYLNVTLSVSFKKKTKTSWWTGNPTYEQVANINIDVGKKSITGEITTLPQHGAFKARLLELLGEVAKELDLKLNVN